MIQDSGTPVYGTTIWRKLISGPGLVLASVGTSLLASGTALAAGQTIEEFEAVQQAAWNAHDAGAYTIWGMGSSWFMPGRRCGWQTWKRGW
jgi:hypothetical protein